MTRWGTVSPPSPGQRCSEEVRCESTTARPGRDLMYDTLPKLLLSNYRRYGHLEVAIREKTMGIWQAHSWADYYRTVEALALSFVEMGLNRGDRVAILGENKPHIYWYELAAQSAGAVVVGVFADCTPPEVGYYLRHSGARFVVCQDQEQVDKVMEIRGETPQLAKILYWDPKGLWKYTDPDLVSFDTMLERGKASARARQGAFEEMISSTRGEDLAVFLYTSGTTGMPKAGMLTHRSLIGMAKALNQVNQFQEGEEYLSFLPIAWIAEQLQGVACSLIYCLRVNFPEKPETVQQNIREIGPQLVFFGPRLWEGLIRTIQVKIGDSSWLHRLFFRTAMGIGYRVADLRMKGAREGLALSLIYLLARAFGFRGLLYKIGLLKNRVGICAGSAVSPDVIRYLRALGVKVKQLYGSSEVGIVTCHQDDLIKPETCGPALMDVDIRISQEGEIQVRTPNMFSGYFGEEERSAAKLREGWYHTGDFGFLDAEGHLVVMDRMEDVLELAGGRKFSPQFCETRLRFSPFVRDALVVGREDQEFVGALINIDLANVGHWAESRGIPYTTFADLSQKPQVIELIRGEIAQVNRILPEHSRIRRFVNLHKEFDPDEAEMTRTRKLRRTFVEERFRQMIDAIFGGERGLEVTSQVTYRDGRTGVTRSRITVNEA